MFDATAKLPDGLLAGNNHLVGAIHECMDVETPSLLNWNGSLIEGFKYVNCVLINSVSFCKKRCQISNKVKT